MERLAIGVTATVSSFGFLAFLAWRAMLSYFQYFDSSMYAYELIAIGVISLLTGLSALLIPRIVTSKTRATAFGVVFGFALSVISIQVLF
jgi:hypothetical protein